MLSPRPPARPQTLYVHNLVYKKKIHKDAKGLVTRVCNLRVDRAVGAPPAIAEAIEGAARSDDHGETRSSQRVSLLAELVRAYTSFG